MLSVCFLFLPSGTAFPERQSCAVAGKDTNISINKDIKFFIQKIIQLCGTSKFEYKLI